MNILGLIGYPLSHSFSPSYFAQKFKILGITDWQYHLFPIEQIEFLINILKETHHLRGLNVTIPYKKKVLDYCTSLSKEAETIGAVNFLRLKDKEIIGYNTDWIGFIKSIENWYQPSLKKVLVLGNGGSSKAIIYSLKISGIPYDVVSRNKVKYNTSLEYKDLNEDIFSSYDLIINCTPLGTTNHEEKLLPLPYHSIKSYQYFYDLVYNPSITEMMTLFENANAKTKNGLEMLQIQADETWILAQNEYFQ